ncbi:MAG: helix-turn-helix domain-containing protein [Bradyrhizobium sp.]|nr:helix-turn-helix domain-containing protein [Pseudomonadota bacterium]MDE2469617.1 helix-turn-helix domain-containing protein [Bradyrhizobium sp.]
MNETQYGTTAKVFHWTIVALLLAQYLIGWLMPDIHRHGSQDKCNTCYGVVAMGQCYCQLSLEERIEIYRLRAAGESIQMIARTLQRHVSTLSREITRNSSATKVWSGGYAPARAQKLAQRRRRWDGRFKLARQPDLQYLVKNRLAMGHSPEQIAGRLTLEHGRTESRFLEGFHWP